MLFGFSFKIDYNNVSRLGRMSNACKSMYNRPSNKHKKNYRINEYFMNKYNSLLYIDNHTRLNIEARNNIDNQINLYTNDFPSYLDSGLIFRRIL